MTTIAVDRVRQLSTGTPGTGNLTLSSTPAGYSAFSAVCTVGDTFNYCISDITNSLWEVGIGQYSASNTLQRLVVKSSSNAGALVNFVSGTREVFMTGIVQDNELYPNVLPSLSLDFVNSDEYLDPRIVVSRNSTATRYNALGNIEVVPANTPRFDYDPVTRLCKGLLVEESRTNTLLYSEQLDNAVWVKTNGGGTSTLPVVTPNYGISPDGTLNADRIELNGGGAGEVGNCQIAQGSQTLNIGTTYTFSFWAKSLGSSFLLTMYNGDAVTNITVTSSWTRFSYTRTIASAGSEVRFAKRDIWGSPGTADFLIWGLQLEVGSFPTSYIPTTTATVTRVTDNCVINNIQSYLNSSEGTIVSDYTIGCADATFRHAFAMFDNTNFGNHITFYQYNNSSISPKINYGPFGSQFEPNLYKTTMTVGSSLKMAMSYNYNNAIASVNGNISAQDTSVLVQFVNKLTIGSYNGGVYICGWIRSLQYYSKANNASVVPLSS